MRRLTWMASAVAAVMATAAFVQSAAPQQVADTGAGRGPRFLLASAARLVPLDIDRTPVLARRLSLSLEGVTLKEALAEISAQAGLRLVYSDDVVPLEKRVHLRADAITVAAALTDVLLGAGVDVVFSRDGGAALVKRTEPVAVQPGSVAGRVTDARTGQGLGGAEVLLEGTRWRTLTADDGQYRLAEVEPGSYTLVARRIGYGRASRSVMVESGQETVIEVALDPVPTKLEEVVVTGTVIPTEVKALPTPITIITAEDIERHHVRRVDEILRLTVPGAVVWEPGYGPSSSQSVTLRGKSALVGSSSNLKMYIDGVEVVSGGNAPIDPQDIERIEVLRGPQAAGIYGSEANGGVIQIFTKRGAAGLARPEVEAQAALGAIESAFEESGALRQEYSAAVSGRSGTASYRVGGGYSRTGEWMPAYGEWGPNLHGGVRVGQGPLTVDLSARYREQRWDEAFNPQVAATGAPFVLSGPSHRRLDTRFDAYGGRLDYSPTGWWRHAVTVGLDRWAYDNYQTRPLRTTPDDTLLFLDEVQFRKYSVSYHTTVTAPLAPGLTANLTAGVNHFNYRFSFLNAFGAVSVLPLELAPEGLVFASNGRTTNTGLFAQAQVHWRERLFLTGGVRIEKSSDFGDELGRPVLPQIGLSYVHQLGTTTVKLRAAYGEAIRAPGPGFKEGSPPNILPSPDLRPERQFGPDAGVDLLFGRRGSLSVTYFDQTAKDFTQLVTVDPNSSPPIFQYQNLARVNNTGWEFEGTLDLSAVSLRGNFAITRSRPVDLGTIPEGEFHLDQQFDQLPKHTGALSLTASPIRRTRVTAGLAYQGSSTAADALAFFRCFGGTGPCNGFDFFDYRTEYPGFATLSLSVDRELTSGVTGYLNVEDLTNEGLGRGLSNIIAVQGRITTVGVRARY